MLAAVTSSSRIEYSVLKFEYTLACHRSASPSLGAKRALLQHTVFHCCTCSINVVANTLHRFIYHPNIFVLERVRMRVWLVSFVKSSSTPFRSGISTSRNTYRLIPNYIVRRCQTLIVTERQSILLFLDSGIFLKH